MTLPLLSNRFILRMCNHRKQSIHQRVDRNSLRFGSVIGKNTMTQHGLGQCLDILAGNVRPPIQQSLSLSTQNQILTGSKSRTPGDKIVDEIRSPLLTRS